MWQNYGKNIRTSKAKFILTTPREKDRQGISKYELNWMIMHSYAKSKSSDLPASLLAAYRIIWYGRVDLAFLNTNPLLKRGYSKRNKNCSLYRGVGGSNLPGHEDMAHNVRKGSCQCVCPAKTRTSLRMRRVWSEYSLSTWRKVGCLAIKIAPSENTE